MRVLQLGPFYDNYLRRWSEHANALGCTVYAAGHVRSGRRPTYYPKSCSTAPSRTGLASRGVLDRIRPDLVHAHWLPRWGYLATASGYRSVVITAWGSDLYLAAGADRERADSALAEAGAVLARSPHMKRDMISRGVAPSRIHEVDLGVDLGRFHPVPLREGARLKAELGLPPVSGQSGTSPTLRCGSSPARADGEGRSRLGDREHRRCASRSSGSDGPTRQR
jgi:hypothetical protein